MRTVDRIFGWLLFALSIALAAFLQRYYAVDAQPLIVCTALCGLLLASINLMRAERPHDRTLARVCVAGNAIFGILMGAVALATTTRLFPLTVAAVCGGLLLLSMRTRRRSRPM